jgi:hypothetical protein
VADAVVGLARHDHGVAAPRLEGTGGWTDVIIVTNKRFMITSGIIETKNSMMPITKVTDMGFMRFLGQHSGTARSGWSQPGEAGPGDAVREGRLGDFRADLR